MVFEALALVRIEMLFKSVQLGLRWMSRMGDSCAAQMLVALEKEQRQSTFFASHLLAESL